MDAMNKAAFAILLVLMANLVSSSGYFRICFDGPIDDDQRAFVEQAGYEIVGYDPGFCYIARGSGNGIALDGCQVEKIGSSQKRQLNALGEIADSQERENVTLLIFPGEDKKGILEQIGKIAPAIAAEGDMITVLSASADEIEQVSNVPGIMKIGKRGELSVFNDYAGPVIGANDAWSRLGIDGDQTIVAVADTGIDTGNISEIHPDFMGRIVGISAWCDGTKLPQYCSGNPYGKDLNGHGTHVSGSVLGNGSMSDGVIKGIAPGARLFMQSLNPNGKSSIYAPDDLRLLFAEAKDAGASIHSSSWGDSLSAYSIDSYLIDDFAFQNPGSLLVFAAGNKGPYSSTLSSQATSKNALAIGSVETPRNGGNPSSVSAFSSRGPASDGRIKPDLVAPGEMILSTKSSIVGLNPCGYGGYDGYYSFCTGTSMATPLAAGSAALVRDYLIGRGYGDPRSADIKAILIAGADRIPEGAQSPNKDAGFGRINLTRSLPSNEKSLDLYHGSIATGNVFSRNFSIARGGGNLAFALVWVDPPCASSYCDDDALVNDVDLKVVTPDGSEYRGNSPQANPPDNDRKNNAEIVFFTDPDPGVYQVEVSGYNVPFGPQDFSMVALGKIDSDEPLVTIESPVDGVYADDEIPLAFTASDETGIDSCWYTIDASSPISLPGCLNTTMTDLARGNHTVIVYANDTSGKNGSDQRSFYSYPAGSMSITVGIANATIWTKSSYYIRFPFTVGFSGVPSARCSLIDPVGKTIASLSVSRNGSYSFSPSIGSSYKSNNVHRMRIMCAYPPYEFVNDTKGVDWVYDTTSPKINASFSGIWVNRSVLDVSYSVSDNLADTIACTLASGTARKTASVQNGSERSESIAVPYQGRNAVSITCKDKSSNSATYSATVYLDSVAPRISVGYVTQAARTNDDGTKNMTISYTITESNSLNSTHYSIDGQINGSLGTLRSGSIKSSLMAGNHTLRIESGDKAMNIGYAVKNFTVR